MVARFGQVIPTGQAVETTEVVSQLDPSFRKVCHGMAGNRFWSARFSRMLVVRFDSDQVPMAAGGARGSHASPAPRRAPQARPEAPWGHPVVAVQPHGQPTADAAHTGSG